MKRAIFTIAIGEHAQKLAEHTHPTIEAYADRIGADLIVANKPLVSTTYPHFEKFQAHSLLNRYDRILLLDTDLIIRDDCPDLFEEVPPDKLGAFNEGAYADRSGAMQLIREQYNVNLDGWKGTYYNTGVTVVSRMHKHLFRKPAQEVCNFYEQTYLNALIHDRKVPVHQLDYRFNRMTVMDPLTGQHRLASYIVHYAGCPSHAQVIDLVGKDLKRWSQDAPDYEYRRRIYVQVHGGIGDEACAEPAVRYVVEKAYPDADVHLATWYPRLFRHLPVELYRMGEFVPEPDEPYYEMHTMAKHGCPSWQYVSPNLMHSTDYSSIMCLRGTIPVEDRTIRIDLGPEDEQELSENFGEVTKDTVLVHPGRGWPSKTFPAGWWREVINGIASDRPVVLIGKHVSNEQGIVEMDGLDGRVKDAVNLLSLGATACAISKAGVLLSNDSAPVHLAGAFDNWIVLIPTCKHPDHVLPYRHGRQNWRAMSLYRMLTMPDSTPTQVHTQTIDWVYGDILDYLPEPEEVVQKVLSLSVEP